MNPDDNKPTFVLRLRPEPSCPDPTRMLRAALKVLLRQFGLRCVDVGEDAGTTNNTSTNNTHERRSS